jgi:hypothetical protein
VLRDQLLPAALICSVIANVHRTEDTERFEPADFLPGAKTKEEELEEFAEAVLRGDTFETDPEELEIFKRQMMQSFRNFQVVPREKMQ